MLLMKHRIQVLSSSLACSSLSASLPNSDCKEKQNAIVSLINKEIEQEEKPGKNASIEGGSVRTFRRQRGTMSCLIWSTNDLTIKLAELHKQIPIAKKIWISIHPRNIGRCLTIHHPTVHLHPISLHHRITPSEFLCNAYKFIVWSK